ncbi:MAG TPA: zinc ribbon domain-containing protein [Tepidisphaeraceae bacterium]|nr:zinc ribbon domain-containing protein [Tepidisphaeraceae bacterium]
MQNEEPPDYEQLVATWAAATDKQVLTELAAIPPLPDEDDPRWGDANDAIHQSLVQFLALADLAAHRRLRPAVRLILDRASYGDPGETMRGLRHIFEAIYKPDWSGLAEEYIGAAASDRPGTRLWVIDSLIVLDDPRAIPLFQAAVRDGPEEVRWRAEIGLERILEPEKVAAKAAAEEAERQRRAQERLDQQAKADAQLTDRRCPACGKPMPSYRKTCKHCGQPGSG